MSIHDQTARSARDALARALASGGFARNERLSRFLSFLVDRCLEDRTDELKESVIGVEVFGRKPDYDPKLDSIVRTEAGRLRARLAEYYAGEGKSDPIVIEVPKGGYVPRFRPATPSPSLPRGFHRPASRIALAAGFLVAIVGAFAVFGPKWRAAAVREPVRIGILPLQNLSAGGDTEFFADGLTDEIISHLSAVDGLEVRSRTSSFALKGAGRNIRELGRQLDVEYVLEGSVARDGERVRINARLVKVDADLPVWSAQFDRAVSGLLEVQDEISRGIANGLRLQFRSNRRRYETNVEAYELYLRARALTEEPPPALFRSIDWFERAVTSDPSFAPAYAGLASMRAIQSNQFVLTHPDDELSKMREAAEKAIQLDPLLAEAHDALAMAHARDAQWEKAEQAFRRAILLDRNRSRSYDDYAVWLLSVLGRNDEALQILRVAERADPLSVHIRLHLGLVLIAVHRYDEAIATCTKLPAELPNRSQCLGRAMLGEGKIDEGLDLLGRQSDLSTNAQARGMLGYAYAKSGRSSEAETMAVASDYPNEQALIFAGLGDKQRTLEALNRMAVLGAQRIGLYLNGPEFELLRDDPRLLELRRRIGLPLAPS